MTAEQFCAHVHEQLKDEHICIFWSGRFPQMKEGEWRDEVKKRLLDSPEVSKVMVNGPHCPDGEWQIAVYRSRPVLVGSAFG